MNPPRILYIEDDQAQRRELTEQLTARGYPVLSCSNGPEGLKLLQNHPVEVVLCDLHMPHMSGLEVLEQARQQQIEVPFIILTAHGSIPYAVEAIRKGAHDFMLKPLQVEALEATIERVMREKAQEEARARQLHLANQALAEKARELQQKTYSLAQANVDMLAVQEKLEAQNARLEQVLQELSQSRNQLQAILDSSSSAIIMVNPEEVITATNSRVEDFFGTPPEDILRLPLETFIERIRDCFVDVKDFQEKTRFLKSLCEECDLSRFPLEEIYTYAVRLRQPVARTVIPLPARVRDKDGTPLGRIWVFHDITEREQAEEHLRLFRKIFLTSVDAVVILNPQNTIVDVNPAVEQLYGYPRQELLGKTPAVFLGEKAFREMSRSFTRKGNYTIRQELTTRTRDGREITVEVSAFPILNDEEEVIYRIGVARDITARKQAEVALRRAHDELEQRVAERTAELQAAYASLQQSEARHLALLNAIPDLMFRLRRDGTYIDYQAPEGSDLTIPREEVVGKTVHDLLPPELARQTLVTLERALRTGKIQVMEYQLPHHDHVHHFEARVVVSGADEVIAIVRDITERKEAEAALRRAHEELEQRVAERTAELARANRELRETQAQLVQSEKMASLGLLVAGIAHEINTPVGAIKSTYDTLVRGVEKVRRVLEKEAPPELIRKGALARTFEIMEKSFRVLASATDRVTILVRRLRSFARLDEAELKQVDIHEGLEDTLMLIHHEIKQGIEVVREYGEVPPISCYPGRLNQVFLNLLINARQAIEGEGRIVIRTWHAGGKVHVSIADNGRGIPEAHLSRIFDPGFTTKGVGVGSGLGLSICYRIIKEDHRGEITVESEVGRGTTFTVSIPDNLDGVLNHS